MPCRMVYNSGTLIKELIMEMSELVELPVFISGDGVEVMVSPEFKKLTPELLRSMAKQMGCTLGFKKVRAVYHELESRHCCGYDCYRPVVEHSHFCEDHQS